MEVKAIVMITRLRIRKRTVGVNQLLMEDHIEGAIADADSSYILVGRGGV